MSPRVWMIDAGMSRDGLLCFCPVELDADGEIENIVVGLSFLSDKPPNGEKCLGAFHPDGQEACEAWCEANREALDAACRPASPIERGDPKVKAAHKLRRPMQEWEKRLAHDRAVRDAYIAMGNRKPDRPDPEGGLIWCSARRFDSRIFRPFLAERGHDSGDFKSCRCSGASGVARHD